MLQNKQYKAIKLLLKYPEDEVVEKLNIKYSTLVRWMKKHEFTQTLKEAEVRRNKSIARIAGNIVLESDMDIKTAMDILKLCKSFELEAISPIQEAKNYIDSLSR